MTWSLVPVRRSYVRGLFWPDHVGNDKIRARITPIFFKLSGFVLVEVLFDKTNNHPACASLLDKFNRTVRVCNRHS